MIPKPTFQDSSYKVRKQDFDLHENNSHKFKQLLDKNLVLLQLSNMVDEGATQTAECSLLFSHFVFRCLQKASKDESSVYCLHSG